MSRLATISGEPGKRRASPVAAIAGAVLFVSLLLGAILYFDWDDEVISLLQWTDAQGAWAPVLFILIMALVVILLLPGVLFTTRAGFVFGVAEGSLYVLLGTTLGACVSFLIARHLLGGRAARFVRRHAGLCAVGDELAPQGWKIVLLSRLIPFFPSKLANYFFGLTKFSLRGFAGGSIIGFAPYTVHNVYLGSLAGSVATAGARGEKWTALQWALYGAGFLATVVMVITVSRLARRALARYAPPR